MLNPDYQRLVGEILSMRSSGELDLLETLYFVKKKFTVALFIKRAEMSGTLETNSFRPKEVHSLS